MRSESDEPDDIHLLDELLDGSAPRLSEPDEDLREAMIALVVATERGVGGARSVRQRPRAAVIGLSAALVLGGTGAAAAATYPDWAPWAQEPDAAYSYTLPSGTECEWRLGNVRSGSGELAQAIRDYVADTDLLAEADIDAAIRTIRSSESTRQLDDGTIVADGYGTEFYDADGEYSLAVSIAIHRLIQAELVRQGFDLSAVVGAGTYTYEGEGYCPGADS